MSQISRAATIDEHILGVTPACLSEKMPVLLVTDVTRNGEIDDTVSLHIYRKLAELGCIKVIAVVSIFGNGGSSTNQVHNNLRSRLAELGINDWPILEGPSHPVVYSGSKITAVDQQKLQAIATAIHGYKRLTIAELGPFTVSAGLLMSGLVRQEQVSMILGIGGRSRNEHFAPRKSVPFAFRDMNVAEDRQAIRYLVMNHSPLLRLITYRSGIGARTVAPAQLEMLGDARILNHAQHRAKQMRLLGYEGKIPIWDTWTAEFFLRGGEAKLGCRPTPARIMYEDTGFKPSDSMQLRLLDAPDAYSRPIIACHDLAVSE